LAVHVKTLLCCLLEDRPLLPGDLRAMPYLPETTSLENVLAAMRRARSEMAVIMDEHGGTAGIVTTDDLVEEVVGEIDESGALPSLYRDAAGILHVDGTVRIEEVGERLGVVLEHDDVDSVSGLILTLLDRPPRVGDHVTFDDVRFDVLAVEGNGVKECAAACVPAEPEGE
jgi:CBS domain containing-hemolysin-like protein